ncbi:MAG: RNA polymerase sigma factor [Parcubacteria group bacterium]|nr:RNA polymerase sigma factor [Parcubacteria group bacterium]
MHETYLTARDEDLLRLSGDHPSVFEVLVERYQAPFLRKAMRVLRNREDAEDAVQETFTKIYLNAAKFEPKDGATFSSWGYRILLNTCFTRYQKKKKSTDSNVYLETEIFHNLPDMAETKEQNEVRDLAASLLAHLPKHLHRVLHLHFLMGYRQQEIADMEGETVGAVKTRIFRAKEELRKIYMMQEQKIIE